MGMRRNVQMLADRIVTGEILLNKLTAHNHLVRSSNTFVAGKEPAAHKRNPEGAEIAWIGPAHQRVGQVFARLERRMLLHREYVVPQYPAPGTVFPNAAARTPGMALTRSSSASLNAFIFSGVSYFFSGQAVLQCEHVFHYAPHIG